jgi:hypothetical protein
MIKTGMFVGVFIVTIIMAGWIWYKMNNIKKILLEEQRDKCVERLRREKEAQFDREGGERVEWI